MTKELTSRRNEISKMVHPIAEYIEAELRTKEEIIDICKNIADCDEIKVLMLCQGQPLEMLYSSYCHQQRPLKDFIEYMVARK